MKTHGKQKKGLSPQARKTAHTKTPKSDRIWFILDGPAKSVLLVHKEVGGREWQQMALAE